MTVAVSFTVPEDPTVRMGDVTIEAKPLLRVGALLAAAEAMVELGLEGDPPAMRLVEMDDVLSLLGDLPGTAEVTPNHPLGMSIYRLDEEPIILIQRGLPAIAERSTIRHELCHLAQARAGRLEIFDGGRLGRWWVMPAGSLQLFEAGTTPPLEAECERFQLDARYHADRQALEATAPPGSTYKLNRAPDGSYGWQLRERVQ